jgi:hypothetical protein
MHTILAVSTTTSVLSDMFAPGPRRPAPPRPAPGPPRARAAPRPRRARAAPPQWPGAPAAGGRRGRRRGALVRTGNQALF